MRRRQIYEQRNKAVAPVVARDSYGVPVSSHTGDTAPAAVAPPSPQPVADLSPSALNDAIRGEVLKRRRGRPPKVKP